jgi:hypothetical protein
LQYKKPEGAAKIESKASADVLATMAHAPRDFMKSNRSKIAQQSAAQGAPKSCRRFALQRFETPTRATRHRTFKSG